MEVERKWRWRESGEKRAERREQRGGSRAESGGNELKEWRELRSGAVEVKLWSEESLVDVKRWKGREGKGRDRGRRNSTFRMVLAPALDLFSQTN